MTFAFVKAHTVDEAIERLVSHGDDAHLIAGGTSVVLLLKQGLIEPAVLVSLARIPELTTITVEPTGIVVGAMTSLHRLERHPAILERVPAVAAAIGQVATVRVRNQATIGGNLAHADPAQDPPPALLVHDASVRVRGPQGERDIALADLFVDVFETSIEPDEVLLSVSMPTPAPGTRAVYLPFLPRTVDDYATVSVAALATLDPDGRVSHVRIALGNAGSVPLRAGAAETALLGRPPTTRLLDEIAALAADDADPVDDIRGTAGYKREMLRVWTRRALETVTRPDGVLDGASA
jgi:carbon-monoxide dehydrogenase medium subunit